MSIEDSINVSLAETLTLDQKNRLSFLMKKHLREDNQRVAWMCECYPALVIHLLDADQIIFRLEGRLKAWIKRKQLTMASEASGAEQHVLDIIERQFNYEVEPRKKEIQILRDAVIYSLKALCQMNDELTALSVQIDVATATEEERLLHLAMKVEKSNSKNQALGYTLSDAIAEINQ